MLRQWSWRSVLPLLIGAVLVYVPLGGWKALYGGQGEDDPAARTYGAVHNVPGFAWVVALNPNGVRSGDARVGFFEQCLIRYRGSVREITSRYSWYSWLSDDTLVEYANPPAPVRGVMCPDGTVFLLPQDELAAYNARAAARRNYEVRLAAEVQSALSARQSGPSFVVQHSVDWVEAANPTGLESFGYRIGFLDVCAIEAGGTVQAIQRTDQGTLYAYTPDPRVGYRGIGIPCPPETVFFDGRPSRRYF